uniref:Uncharacterized protein n=1 Tax=Plectus sambesii TaxID=2011161 RepID=A0A914X3F2_9BILA
MLSRLRAAGLIKQVILLEKQLSTSINLCCQAEKKKRKPAKFKSLTKDESLQEKPEIPPSAYGMFLQDFYASPQGQEKGDAWTIWSTLEDSAKQVYLEKYQDASAEYMKKLGESEPEIAQGDSADKENALKQSPTKKPNRSRITNRSASIDPSKPPLPPIPFVLFKNAFLAKYKGSESMSKSAEHKSALKAWKVLSDFERQVYIREYKFLYSLYKQRLTQNAMLFKGPEAKIKENSEMSLAPKDSDSALNSEQPKTEKIKKAKGGAKKGQPPPPKTSENSQSADEEIKNESDSIIDTPITPRSNPVRASDEIEPANYPVKKFTSSLSQNELMTNGKATSPTSEPLTEIQVKPKMLLMAYDFETTGLSPASEEILQVAVMTNDQQRRHLSSYFLPKVPIHPTASAVTGLSVKNKTLWRHGKALPTVDVERGMSEFVDFIEEQLSSQHDTMAVMVAHNGHRFDHIFLVKYMKRFGLHLRGVWQRVLFCDSLLHARRSYNSYKLIDVHKRLCPDKNFDAHNAVGDCQAVLDILQVWQREVGGCEQKLIQLLRPIESVKMMR